MSKLLRLGVLLLLGFPMPMQAEIPIIIHQIWIGEQLPAYMEMVRQRFTELNPGWQYNLWLTSEQDLDSTNGSIRRVIQGSAEARTERYPIADYFANEWSAIKAIRDLERRPDNGTNRKAFISDLMRYRIVYNEGGYYFDMKFELLRTLEGVANSGTTFLGANEDHQGFAIDRSYLSNAFFAATPGHPALEPLLEITKNDLKEISDGLSIRGPSEFGQSVLAWLEGDPAAEQQAQILPSEQIYPYINWDDTPGAAERGIGHDQCIASSPEAFLNHPDDTRIIPAQNTFGETIYMLYPCPHYPDSLAVDHFDFGSSWYEEEE